MRAAATALTGLAILALPSSALAAQTIGSPLTARADLFSACDASPDPPEACTVVQTAAAGSALTSPITGVITRWRIRTISLGTVTLRILRPNPDGTYTGAGSSLPQALTQRPARGEDVPYTFQTRLAVQQGDLIALDRDRRAGGVYRQTGSGAFALGVFVPPLADFESGAPEAGQAGAELMLNADVEPDEDGDGFGDQSQDNCPSIPNDQSDNPCPASAPSQPVRQPDTTGTGDTGPAIPVFRRHGPRARRPRPAPLRPRPAGDQFRRHGPRRRFAARVAIRPMPR